MAKSNSNLKQLLNSLTPNVPMVPLPKGCVDDLNKMWNPVGTCIEEYFILEKLWNSYRKCSAYGAGVPVTMNDGEKIIQYFVPYLSAIQIFTIKPFANIRHQKENDCNGTEYESGSWTDDSDNDRLSRSVSNDSSGSTNKASDTSSTDSGVDNVTLLPLRNPQCNAYIKFNESDSPYCRTPLVEKINELAHDYPGLMTLRSTDLSPASWMAVAWYPIYCIPPKLKPAKDFSAAFLTFHTLSSFLQGGDENALSDEVNGTRNSNNRESNAAAVEPEHKNANEEVVKIALGKLNEDVDEKYMPLPPFGLASLWMAGDVFLTQGESDRNTYVKLNSAATSWLKQLSVYHHDFTFFTVRSKMQQ